MYRYVIRRLIQAIPTLFGITILSYMLMSISGNPVAALTFRPGVTPEERERLAIRLGVNDPIYIQYIRWLTGDDWMRRDTDGDGIADTAFLIPLDADGDGEAEPPGENKGILRGDFGKSFTQRNRDAMSILLERLPATLELSTTALSIGLLIGIPIGILSAVYHGGWFDNISRILSVAFDAIPNFWFGLLLILTFGIGLNWVENIFGFSTNILPYQGRADAITIAFGDYPPLWGRLEYLIMPATVLAVGVIAGYSRFTRASMLDVLTQDYMRTARSKGLSNRAVWFRHGARNALIPIATFLGPALTGLIGGAAITETVFSWPGVGLEVVRAVTQRNYPVVMAAVLLSAIATIIGYLLSDILYALIDPRIRF